MLEKYSQVYPCLFFLFSKCIHCMFKHIHQTQTNSGGQILKSSHAVYPWHCEWAVVIKKEAFNENLPTIMREHSSSVVECLTRDRGAAGSSLTGVTELWSLSKNIDPSLVLVQPRKTHPFITERLLMGRKESNQTNKKQNLHL